MTDPKRYRFPKTFVFIITALYLVLIAATYILFYKGVTEVCAKRMISAQVVALLFQILLNYVNYRSQQKIVILATLFISAAIMLGAISAFFNLQMMCQFYNY